MKSHILCILWAIFNTEWTSWLAITKKHHVLIFHWDTIIMLRYFLAKFQLVLAGKDQYNRYFRAPWRVLAILRCSGSQRLFHMWAFIVLYNSSEHCLAQLLSFHGVWIGLLMQWIRTLIEKFYFYSLNTKLHTGFMWEILEEGAVCWTVAAGLIFFFCVDCSHVNQLTGFEGFCCMTILPMWCDVTKHGQLTSLRAPLSSSPFTS